MKLISRCAAAAVLTLTAPCIQSAGAETVDIGNGSLAIAGPIPVADDSHPFGAVYTIDLDAAGYVEEEYFVSGKANVYTWNDPDKGVEVQSADAPYTTRIMVIRPKDKARFNGRVMVDIVNMTNGWDFNKMWAAMHVHLMEDGWAYVGITSKPNAVKALKVFDPKRYAPLSWANPLALDDARNCSEVPQDSSRDTENGLAWDIFSEIGKAIRSSGVFADFGVEKVFLTGYSQSGRFLYTYINGFHSRDRLANGKPIYDGYLMGGAPIGSAAQSINQCSENIAAPDPRAWLMKHDAPVIDVVGSMDVIGLIDTYPMRQEDSDDPTAPYRLWEVAGASHSWLYQNGFNVSAADVEKAGFANFADRIPPSCAMLEHPNDLRMHFAMDAALDALDAWATDGTPAPHADRIEVEKKDGQPAFVLDADGNQKGGYRLPELMVPTASYIAGEGDAWKTFKGCWSWSHAVPFTHERLKELYPSQGDFVAKMLAASRELIARKLLTPEDAERAMTAAGNVNIP